MDEDDICDLCGGDGECPVCADDNDPDCLTCSGTGICPECNGSGLKDPEDYP